jgi:hypothetical protein
VAVGALRPAHIFFYEIDKKSNKWKNKLIEYGHKYFNYFSIFRTRHGFHFIAYGFSNRKFQIFKRVFRSDFARKLRPKWGRKEPQILRISEKINLKTGKIVSKRPKWIYGNFFIDFPIKCKVLYYAK